MKHKKDHIEKIFGATPHIDVDLVIGYLDNSLTPAEQHQVERALIDDPFLEDAIEGLRELPQEGRKEAIYAILGKEATKQIKLEIHPMVWKIAAVTIVAISSIYFVSLIDFSSSSSELAMEEVKEEAAEAAPEVDAERTSKGKIVFASAPEVNDSSQQVDSNMAEIALAMETPEEEDAELVTISMPNATPEPSADAEVADLAFMEDAEAEPAPEMNREDDYMATGSVSRSANGIGEVAEEIASAKKMSKPSTRSTTAIANDMIKTLKRKGIVEGAHLTDDESGLSKKEASALAKFKEGMEAYNRGNYHTSVKRFEEAYKQNKNIPEIRYYLTTSHLYGNNNIGKAKKVFKNESTGKYGAEKQWVDAIIELGAGKEKTAKEKLEKISQGGGKFKGAADAILGELK